MTSGVGDGASGRKGVVVGSADPEFGVRALPAGRMEHAASKSRVSITVGFRFETITRGHLANGKSSTPFPG